MFLPQDLTSCLLWQELSPELCATPELSSDLSQMSPLRPSLTILLGTTHAVFYFLTSLSISEIGWLVSWFPSILANPDYGRVHSCHWADGGFVSPLSVTALELKTMPVTQAGVLSIHITCGLRKRCDVELFTSLGFCFSLSLFLSCILQNMHHEKQCDLMLAHRPWIGALGLPVT